MRVQHIDISKAQVCRAACSIFFPSQQVSAHHTYRTLGKAVSNFNTDASSSAERKAHTYEKATKLDFNRISGSEQVFRYLKRGDAKKVSALLRRTPLFKQHAQRTQPFSILDIGGDNGWMLFAVTWLMAIKAKAFIVEPNKNPDKLGIYCKAITMSNQILQQGKAKIGKVNTADIPYFEDYIGEKNLVTLGGIYKSSVQDITQLPSQMSITLFSHSAYYLKNELGQVIHKLLRTLSKDGVLTVVVQSIEGTNKRTAAGGELFNHESLEDFVYPLVENITHGQNTYYVNSKHFELELNSYKKHYIAKYKKPPDWTIQTDLAITSVPLGNVNTDPNEHGHYVQFPQINKILRFYLKGKSLCELPPDKQKKFIEHLEKHFQNEQGDFVVTHVNRVYTIAMGEKMYELLHRTDPNNKTPLSSNL